MTREKRTDRLRLTRSTISWPSFRRSEVYPSADAVISSPGLEQFTRHVAGAERPHVLDLGAPCTPNIDFIAQYDCVHHIADLYRGLSDDPGMSAPEEERDVEAAMTRVVTYDDDVRFAGILVWNLLDYLDAPVVRALVDRIAGHCHAGTILLMMTSTGETIPDDPGRISIMDERHLRFERVGAGTRDGARYSPRALERLLPGFRIQHSYLLRDGMQDYLWTCN